MGYEFELNGEVAHIHPVRPPESESAGDVGLPGDRFDLVIDGLRLRAERRPGREPGAWRLLVDGVEETVWIATRGDTHFIHLRGRAHRVEAVDALERARREAAPTTGVELLRAPMPGVVVEVAVEVGARVEPGELLMMIESMKLQTPIVAPDAARVEEICVEAGASFDQGAALVRLARDDAETADAQGSEKKTTDGADEEAGGGSR
jgi:3-methylcrotonyl-CoA carboxylase alpha subunit